MAHTIPVCAIGLFFLLNNESSLGWTPSTTLAYLGYGKEAVASAQTYSEGLGAETPTGFSGRVPGQRVMPPEAEIFLASGRSMDAVNLPTFLRFENIKPQNFRVVSPNRGIVPFIPCPTLTTRHCSPTSLWLFYSDNHQPVSSWQAHSYVLRDAPTS